MVEFDDIDEMLEALDTVPDADKLTSLSKLAAEMVRLDIHINEMEEDIKLRKIELYEMQTKTLPDMMLEIGTDVIGVPEAGVNIVLEKKCHASISKEWEPDRRAAAYDHLREIGGGDLIKNELVVSAGRGSDEKMRQIASRVTQMLAEVELEASVNIDSNVQWNTLTSFVKSTLEAGDVPVDLPRIGATYMSVAKIAKKKTKKG